MGGEVDRDRGNRRKYTEGGLEGQGWWVLVTGNLVDIPMWYHSL